MPKQPPKRRPEYKPSRKTAEALAAWKRAVEEEERLRLSVRAALAEDLIADTDLPYQVVADHPSIPWSMQTLRQIGWEYNVPPRQPSKAKQPSGKD
ncbi:hypothetical protein [Streptomyces parvulus]|uniref:hypothetical protein n=1 Tax=Streptomyces parvulus TaxID=146923 RepID=UPI0037FEFDBF